MIRIGIIGFGKMGVIRCDAVKESGMGVVTAIMDERAVKAPKGVRVHASAQELISDPEIDAVFICTPNYLNKPLTLRALAAGKHVFCEKPPAFTAPDVDEIIAAEKAAGGKKLMYGFNHRHHDSIIKAKEIIGSEKHGRILWMRGRYGKSVDEDFFKSWRSKKEFAGGGIMLDQGIHMLDLFLFLGGDFDEVHATVSNLYWKLDVEDNVFAIFRNTKTGLVASLHSTMTHWRHLFSLEIFMERGYIVINGLLTSSGMYGKEELTVATNRTQAPAAEYSSSDQTSYTVNNSWRYEVEHFLGAIEKDIPVKIGTSGDALKLMRIMDRIYDRSHCQVAIS